MNNTNADALNRIHRVTTRKQSAAISKTYPDTPGQNISETQVDQEPLLQHELSTNSDDSHATDEYQKFLQAKSEHIALTPNLKEITEDIFDTQSDIPLALCVSEDLKMNKGITLEFRRKLFVV